MIEIGHFAILLALGFAGLQSILPMIGAAKGDRSLMQSARATALIQSLLLTLALLCLIYAFATSDFSVKNVYENSHSAKPLIYKIAASWGSHEGSLLLWVFILTLFGAFVALFGQNLPSGLKARTLSVQAWITFGFLTFLIFTSNPFLRIDPAPLDGQDLNPLLQHIGLALHPPLLYLGYVGFSIVFSFAIAALIEGEVTPAWARWVRPWTLAAWIALTAGIGLGSWWAYYELGWGGWWFWDPVENVSFMPWLLGTALLHSAIVTEKRDAFKNWTILLAILTFALSLLGTFIVRSGLLTSVHAFAVDPTRGLYILIMLGLFIGASLSLYAWRAPNIEDTGLFSPISRETGLILNNLLLATGAATVFLGTLYPLFLEAFSSSRISVGPPYFNRTFVPLMVPLVIIMGVGPRLNWKRAELRRVLARLNLVTFLVALIMLGVWYATYGGPILAVLGIGLAFWLLLSTLGEFLDRIRLFSAPKDAWSRARTLPRSAKGMTLAHTGLAVAILGFVGSSLWKTEQILFVEPGRETLIAGYSVTFDGVNETAGANYIARQGILKIEKDGKDLGRLFPERRFYPASGSTTTESAVRQSFRGDLYASIVEPTSQIAKGQWTLRLSFEPLINCIWIGLGMLVLGGILSLSDRRYRIGTAGLKRGRP